MCPPQDYLKMKESMMRKGHMPEKEAKKMAAIMTNKQRAKEGRPTIKWSKEK